MKKILPIVLILTILFSVTALAYKEYPWNPVERRFAYVEIVEPPDGSTFIEGDTFIVTAQVQCIVLRGRPCHNTTAEIVLPSGLSLPNNDPIHYLGNLKRNEIVNTSWLVSADSIGNYQITVNTYIEGGFSDSDSRNVSVESPLPDLIAISLDVPSNIYVGNSYDVNFTIYNNGSSVGNISYAHALHSNATGSWEFEDWVWIDLDGNESESHPAYTYKYITFNWTPQHNGTYHLRAWADWLDYWYAGLVNETYEDNNVIYELVIVS